MRYTHFVFDIDNTLINTTGAVLHGLQRALRDITGEHWDLSRLTPVLGIPGLDAFERLGIHSPEQIFQIYPRWEQYEQEYQYTAYLYEGIVPLLDFLKKKGCSLGIITSKTMPQYTSSFLPFQISEYFQTVINRTLNPCLHIWNAPESAPGRFSTSGTVSTTCSAPPRPGLTPAWLCGDATVRTASHPPTVLRNRLP